MIEHKDFLGCTSLSVSKEQILLVILSLKQGGITGLKTQLMANVCIFFLFRGIEYSNDNTLVLSYHKHVFKEQVVMPLLKDAHRLGGRHLWNL